MRRRAILLVLCLAACGAETEKKTAIGGSEPAVTPYQAAEKKAVRATGALMKNLITRLTGALQEGPPEHALDICSQVAQAITRRIAAEEGVRIRRTALRVRNPENRPDDWERAWFEKAHKDRTGVSLTYSERVAGPDGKDELRFVKAIYLQEMCLACHGPKEQLRTEVRELLEERYPEDEATGYKAGDLRGIVSVRVPIEE